MCVAVVAASAAIIEMRKIIGMRMLIEDMSQEPVSQSAIRPFILIES